MDENPPDTPSPALGTRHVSKATSMGSRIKNQEITDLQLWLVSETIGEANYKKLGHRLKIKKVDLDNFQHDTGKKMTFATFKMLTTWNNHKGDDHYKLLSKALSKVGLKWVVRKVLRKKHTIDPVYSGDQTPLMERQLQDIANKLPNDMRIHLGLRLGLSAVHLDEIESDEGGNINAIKYKILHEWQNNFLKAADQMFTLAKIMEATGLRKLARIIRQNHLGMTKEGTGIEYALEHDLEGQHLDNKHFIHATVTSRDKATQREAENIVQRAITKQNEQEINKKLQEVCRLDGKYEVRKLKQDSIHLVFAVYSSDGARSLEQAVQTGSLGESLGRVLISDETRSTRQDVVLVVEIAEDEFAEAFKYFDKVGAFQENMECWSTDVVKNWTDEVAKLPEAAISKLNGVDGTLLRLYQKQHLNEDCGLSLVHCTKILRLRDEHIKLQETQHMTRSSRAMAEWDTCLVSEWLQKEGFCEGVIRAFAEVDGESLKNYSLGDLREDTGITQLEGRRLVYLRDRYLASQGEGTHTGPGNSTSDSMESSGSESEMSEASSTADENSIRDLSIMMGENLHFQVNATDEVASVLGDQGNDTLLSEVEKGQVQKLLTGQEAGFFDSSYNHILVANAPSSPSAGYMAKKFNFLLEIDWCAVLDCDHQSMLSGLCNLVGETRPMKVQKLSNFDNVKDVEKTCSDLEFPDVPSWMFLNGREDEKGVVEEKLPSKTWMKQRLMSASSAIRFFKNPAVIPEGRERVLFLLLSDQDIYVLSQVFREFMTANRHFNYTVIAEKRAVFNKWKDEVTSQGIVSSDEIDDRAVVGNFVRINEEVWNQIGDIETCPLEFQSAPGSTIKISKFDRMKLTDLTVVGSNICQNTAMTRDCPRFDDFARTHEEQFYRGYEVDWWNFHFTDEESNGGYGFNHVLKRDGSSKLYREIMKPRYKHDKGTLETGSVEVVTIFHQPGAGGTTLGKQMLWDCRKECRCIAVDKVSSSTVDQMMTCLQYGLGNESKTQPLIALLDNIEPAVLRQLIRDTHSRIKNDSPTSSVILLHCQSCTDAAKQGQDRSNQPCVFVEQKLSEKESQWFMDKIEDLQGRNERKLSCPTDKLIGFMALKEECNEAYFQKVVRDLLPEVNKKTSNFINLLKFIAVIQKYVPKFALPVAICEGFIPSIRPADHHKRQIAWEKKMPEFLQVMLTEKIMKTVPEGTIPCVCTVSQNLAKEIVKQLVQLLGETEADMVVGLIDSLVVGFGVRGFGMIKEGLRELFVYREAKLSGRGKTTTFSPFLEQARTEVTLKYETQMKDKDEEAESGEKTEGTKGNVNFEEVYSLLHSAVDKLRNPYVAQALARMYLVDERFNEALEAIDKAISIHGNNTYFWDTKGRIFHKMMSGFEDCRDSSSKTLDSKQVSTLCSILQETIQAFSESKRHAWFDCSVNQNLAGFEGEVKAIFSFLFILRNQVTPFNAAPGTTGLIELSRYLTSEYVPGEIGISSENHKLLKGLADVVRRDIDHLSDVKILCSSKESKKEKEFMEKREKNWKKFFMTRSDIAQAERHHQRKSEAIDLLTGTRIDVIFQQARTQTGQESMKEALEKLSGNRPYTLFDVRTLTFMSFALSTFQECPLHPDTQQWVKELKEHEEGRGGIYGLYFEMLLLWSVINPSLDVVNRVNQELKRKWNARYSGGGFQKESSKVLVLRPLVKQPYVEFYLGRNGCPQRLIHKSNKDNVNSLCKLQGVLIDKHTVQYLFGGKKSLLIKLGKPCKSSPSEEAVTFFLGFSFAGLRATDVSYVRGGAPDSIRPVQFSLPSYLDKDDSGFESDSSDI